MGKQKIERLFTKDVNVTKNGEGSQIRIIGDFKNHKKVKCVVYGIVEA